MDTAVTVLASYRQERQVEANAHDLRAGYRIHIPVIAPQRVQNAHNWTPPPA